MFRDTRRKKLRNQVILAALAVCLMTFGIWLNYKTVVDQDGSEEAAKKVKVESSQADQNSEERGDTSAKQPAADTAEEEETYYIKEVDGVVKVFACQGEEKKLYLITSIPFELLSQTANAPGMGLTCELWLGPATWSYTNAALEAARIDMHARGFSTEDAIESKK